MTSIMLYWVASLIEEGKIVTTVTVDIGNLIIRSHKVRGRQPCIAGTDVTVQ